MPAIAALQELVATENELAEAAAIAALEGLIATEDELATAVDKLGRKRSKRKKQATAQAETAARVPQKRSAAPEGSRAKKPRQF